jgi:hypothetical protein
MNEMKFQKILLRTNGQAKPSGNNFSDFPDDENDVFTPVDDSDDIPF